MLGRFAAKKQETEVAKDAEEVKKSDEEADDTDLL